MNPFSKNQKREIFVLLENIRSAENVGSIFRTAEAAGVKKIFLCGYTPSPLDRFGRKRKDVAKAALGAEESVPWESHPVTTTFARALKKRGVHICSVEQAPGSISFRKIPLSKSPVCYVFGNEISGVSKNLLALSDTIAEIPMRGEKESLNVSVAAGIILFR